MQMLTSYSVIQFIPDPISGESINIGIVAWDDDGIKTSMIKDWRRVSSFAYGEIEFLKDFSRQLKLLASEQPNLPGFGDDGTLKTTKIKQPTLYGYLPKPEKETIYENCYSEVQNLLKNSNYKTNS